MKFVFIVWTIRGLPNYIKTKVLTTTYRKCETRDPGRPQVGPRETGPGTPKCLGGTRDLGPRNIQEGPGTWDH